MRKLAGVLSVGAVLLLLAVVPGHAMVSAFIADRLDLYQGRNWIYQNVGGPDRIEWSGNFGTNLEMYRISDSPLFDSVFVGYSADGFVHVMGQIYRPGVATVGSLCANLEGQGGRFVGSNWNGRAYLMSHKRTGRSVYAVVEPNANLGPVLYLLTQEAWNVLN
ncbi:hypothetical protein KAR29_01115 [Aminithiophilus ramosus]|uniref:Uncharacterized protein n=2 Tax=Synergistales TaxID=649776 RepID=A0A9Q7EW71_9BACT|nr:hypothetical protein [Aminithiophilus ramosus]QTX32574.1 hypothetical protein KAR29_01115 [Aminithiophilus ramosus]QVL36454.1 hypothetical protein KIH16_01125 [Synergistota bacterium]